MPRSVKEHSSSAPEAQSNQTLGQAVSAYIASLSTEAREAVALDLNTFTRWFGPHRPISTLTAPDLDRYQEQLAESRTDSSSRLEALRDFLRGGKKQGWTATNLSTQVKVRRKKNSAGKAGRESTENTIRLTREGHEKLSEELRFLEKDMRVQIADELKKAAADKDFRENAPYDVAKQHQGEVEARIRELQHILGTGQIVEMGYGDKIDLGSTVTLLDLADDEIIIYTLVGPGEINPRKGKISIQSPVGRALAGHVARDEVGVEVPAGKLRLRVEKVQNG
ncbi:MAG TPA: transcription elongation factor GreA [Chloroflexota bacterium]|nr:transcription elongation factor GreA [Chloroflexota bacterium]